MRFIAPANNGGRLLAGISGASAQSGLGLCLDAGDAMSYSGGAAWLDVSGAGNHFNRGSGSGSSSDDPTFVGTIGGASPSEYFLMGGDDAFSLAAASNPAFIDAMHADNASFSILSIHYVPAGAVSVLFSTESGGSSRGIDLDFLGDTTLRIFELNGSNIGFANSVPGALINNAWCAVHVSIAEGVSNGSVVSLNGATVQAFTANYTSPTSGSATHTAKIGTRGSFGINFDGNNVRRAGVAAWSRALSAAEHTAVYNQIKAGFGLP